VIDLLLIAAPAQSEAAKVGNCLQLPSPTVRTAFYAQLAQLSDARAADLAPIIAELRATGAPSLQTATTRAALRRHAAATGAGCRLIVLDRP
jgi:hypothetical protein